MAQLTPQNYLRENDFFIMTQSLSHQRKTQQIFPYPPCFFLISNQTEPTFEGDSLFDLRRGFSMILLT